jgi:plastocyanin
MLAAILALILVALVTVRHETRAATVTVGIENLAFAPGSVTVAVGTTVTWVNQETAASKIPHTATSDNGTWNSGLLNPGASFAFTFTKAGTFTYRCDVHPSMHGTITVTAPATPTPTHVPPTAVPTSAPTATTAPTPTAAPTTAPVAPGAPTPTPTLRPTATIRPTATVRATPTATPLGATPGATVSAASTAPPTATDIPPSSSAPPIDTASDDPPPPAVNPFLTVAPFTDTATERFLVQTGHTLRNDFRTFWEAHGGAAIFGYPVSEEYREREADGIVRTVQYFERARFEYHDEFASTPDAVELGALARELTLRRLNEQPFQPIANSGSGLDRVWFDGTGHSLRDAFKQYWDTNGGIAIFGLPISEPFMEQGADDSATHLVQYFERARFELHPSSAGAPVVLGRLGVQYAQWYGMLPTT